MFVISKSVCPCRPFKPSLMFAAKAILSRTPLKGRLLAFFPNIRLDWKCLPRVNAQAYYEHS